MFGGVSIWQLLIVLVIVVVLFGTKKLKNVGGDLGDAIKGFKKGLKDDDKPEITDEMSETTAEKVESKGSEKPKESVKSKKSKESKKS